MRAATKYHRRDALSVITPARIGWLFLNQEEGFLMMNQRISAVFDSHQAAERAIAELRAMGLDQNHLSVIAQHQESRGGGGGMVADAPVREVAADDTAEKAGKGLAAGAGLGALFGLATAFIPGVGPFLAAGSLAASIGTIGASAIGGAVVGGAAGAIAGALTKYGYTEEESRFYGPELERGGYLVSVDAVDNVVPTQQVIEVLKRHGGRTAPGSAWI
jgi:hypothetical protein